MTHRVLQALTCCTLLLACEDATTSAGPDDGGDSTPDASTQRSDGGDETSDAGSDGSIAVTDGGTSEDGSTILTDGGTTETDSGTSETLIRTGTLTLGDQTWAVVPEVRRGLGQTPADIITQAVALPGAREVTLSCGPSAVPQQGGRYILITNHGQMGASYTCQGGGIVDATQAIRTAANNLCSTRGSCTVDVYSAFHGGLWGCTGTEPSSIYVTYACRALSPASPAMQITASHDDFSVQIAGLDGPGSASCAERGATFTVPGYSLAPEAPCTIDITDRSGSDLYGVVNATLIDDATEESVTFSLDFSHERNVFSPSLSVATATDLCRSTAISHTTKIEGDDTIDVVRAAPPFTCAVSEEPLTEAIEIEITRHDGDANPESTFACGERITIRSNGKTSLNCRGVRVDEERHALRAIFDSITLCNGDDCDASDEQSFYALSYAFTNPSE